MQEQLPSLQNNLTGILKLLLGHFLSLVWVCAALQLLGEENRQQIQQDSIEEAVHVQDKSATSVAVSPCQIHGE